MRSQYPGTDNKTSFNKYTGSKKIKERVCPLLKREGKTVAGDTRKACSWVGSCISSHSLKHCSQRQESHRQGLFKDEAESICCSSQTPEMMRLRAVTFCPFRCAEHQQLHLHDDLSSPCFSELVNVLRGQHLPL